MGTKNTRMFKIDWLMARVKANKHQEIILDEEKLIGEFVIFFASTRRTAIEILKSLESAGRIIREYGEIWTPEIYHIQKADEELKNIQSKVNSKQDGN